MAIRFEINHGDLEANQGVTDWFRRFGAQCLREAQQLAAERISGGTGQYERSFEIELVPGSPPKLRFGNSAPHAIYIEEDTQPHTIVPKDRKALRWFDPPGGGGGAAVFAQKVNHPGTTGQHIIRDAVTAAGDKLRAS